jgi:DivIVA protein
MNYFQRSSDTLDTQYDEYDQERTHDDEEGQPGRGGLAGFGSRIARAFANLDRGRAGHGELEAGPPLLGPDDDGELAKYDVPGTGVAQDSPPFPVAALGYNRAAVDHYVAELERELDEMRTDRPPVVSITEEIERLGEQTASILVVAHDQAHETSRLAQEQADRCIADAASNAVAITEQAKQQLRELDNETDTVWHERRRLIEDVRTTATALFALAEDAIDRFPEDAADRVADEGRPTVESGVVPSED